MSELVCVKDGRVLKIQENGVLGELLDDDGKPYKIYYADRWGCPECGWEVLMLAPNAVHEHWHMEYDRYQKHVTVTFQH